LKLTPLSPSLSSRPLTFSRTFTRPARYNPTALRGQTGEIFKLTQKLTQKQTGEILKLTQKQTLSHTHPEADRRDHSLRPGCCYEYAQEPRSFSQTGATLILRLFPEQLK
jgi:hypothetical protein